MAPYSTSFHPQQQFLQMHPLLQSLSLSPHPITYTLPPPKDISFSLNINRIQPTNCTSFTYQLVESIGSTEFFNVRHKFPTHPTNYPLAFSSVEKDHYEITSPDKNVDKVSKVDTGFSIILSDEPEKSISLNDKELLKNFNISQSKVRTSALVTRICTVASVVFTGAALAAQITRPYSTKLYLIPLALSIIGAIGASYKNRYDSLDLATIILNIRTTARQLN